MSADPAAAAGPAGQHALYHAIADAGSIDRFGERIEAGNPSGWPGYEEQLRRARKAAGAPHAVTTGVATAGGEPCVIVGFEFAFMGGSMGVAEGARIARAFSVATAKRLPVVCVAASGGSRMQEGTSALVQMQAVAAAIAAARSAGIPLIAVAGDPTTGGVWASLVAAADVLIGVPGARVSFSGSRTRPAGADPGSAEFLADGKWAHGFVDVLSPVDGLRAVVGTLVRLLSPRSRGANADRVALPAPPAGPGGGDPGREAWAQVDGARSTRRDRAASWLAGYFEETFEIRGDRCGGVDAGLRCGFGRRGSATVGYVAQTGRPTTPAGFRTATRLLALATRFGRPVLTLIDTPGAAAAPADEAAGTGPAIAELFVAVASCQVPITSVIIGEGVSGGALALASPTDLWLAHDGYLAVTAPELATSILKLPAHDAPGVARRLRLTPAELLSRGIIRGIVPPPGAGG
ncbi:MAG TPA: carboxyl transferase domain-containing protein [Streptosporangiaceae bacterium]|nr:carboxyl transferase domain-containing protein [Streptosporangiaceae bacterium]